MSTRVRTYVELRPEVRRRLEAEAVRQERSLRWMAERLIREALDAREQRREEGAA